MITEINIKKSLLSIEIGSSERLSIFSKEFSSIKIEERGIGLFILTQKFREKASQLKIQKKGVWNVSFKNENLFTAFEAGTKKIKILKITRIS